MDTRKLYRNGDFIIVDAGSDKERELRAAGWKSEPEKAVKGRSQTPKQPPNSAHLENPGPELPPAA